MALSFPKTAMQTEKKSLTTSLHEYCFLGKLQRPVVELYFSDGLFISRITVVELNISGYGSGERRTTALEQAAERLLRKLNAPVLEGVNHRPRISGGLVEMLYRLCQIADFFMPEYQVYTTDEENRVFIAMCQVGTNKSFATGLSQNDAMQIAAKDMMDTILDGQQLTQGDRQGAVKKHDNQDQYLLIKFKAARLHQRMEGEFYKIRQYFQKKNGDGHGME